MNKNSLIEIPAKDWPKLCDLYADRKLESNSWLLLQNYIKWIDKDPSLKNSCKIYSLNGNWSDGTFVVIDHTSYIMINTHEESQERLLEALRCLDNKSELKFLGCPIRIQRTMETYLTELGIKKESFDFQSTMWYHIKMEEALNFNTDPPKGITLSAIRKEDIDTINSEWPHNHPGSELFIGRLVKFNHNIGAYDENGKLVAWCLILTIGTLGLLQVLESHKRKGLGSLVVRALSKINAEQGIETISPVVENNVASRRMFESLGFQLIDKIFWFFKPELN